MSKIHKLIGTWPAIGLPKGRPMGVKVGWMGTAEAGVFHDNCPSAWRTSLSHAFNEESVGGSSQSEGFDPRTGSRFRQIQLCYRLIHRPRNSTGQQVLYSWLLCPFTFPLTMLLLTDAPRPSHLRQNTKPCLLLQCLWAPLSHSPSSHHQISRSFICCPNSSSTPLAKLLASQTILLPMTFFWSFE